jgi:hypothetical protein
VAEALEGLLARSLETFRAESAEVILFQRDGVPLRTTLGPAASAVMQPMDPATAAALAALVNDEQPVVSLIQPFGSERLDDFGTGYSSLSYLHSLPLDILNVAKPFVDGLTGGGRESRFVGMILDLARALGPRGDRGGHRERRAGRRVARAEDRVPPGLLSRAAQRGRRHEPRDGPGRLRGCPRGAE